MEKELKKSVQVKEVSDLRTLDDLKIRPGLIFVEPTEGKSAETEFKVGYDFSSIEAFNKESFDENERGWVFRIIVGEIMKISCSGISCSGKFTVPALKEDEDIKITYQAIKGNQKLITTRAISVSKNTESTKSPLLESVSQAKDIIKTLSDSEK